MVGAPAWGEARNVLCIRLDSMGDVLMTGPAIRALKDATPSRHITLMTSLAGADAARRMPGIDDVLTYGAPWMKAEPTRAASRQAIVHELASRHFDAAVIFTLHSQSPLAAALLCWLAGIPLVAARCRENPYHLVTNWVREDESERVFRHDVERQLSLVAALGTPPPQDGSLAFRVDESDRRAADAIIAAHGLRPGHWCMLHPGASAASRRYPSESFAAAARSLITRDGWRVIVTAGPGEEALGVDTARLAGGGAAVMSGLSLGMLAALIEAAPVLIANNSGPAHLAAAVSTPVVDLYALTNPQHAPWGVPHRLLFHDVPCRFCYRSVCPEGHHRCLTLVDPEQVAEAARDLAAGHVRGEVTAMAGP
jgi:lipopolysaccharide heptosyltransferase II